VDGLTALSSDTSAWSFGGSILTFAFPMFLFIVVAVGLYILYTKPEVVPGHRVPSAERPVSYTAIPGTPTATEVPGSPATAAGDPVTATGNPAEAGTPVADEGTEADEGENTEPEGQA